MRAAVVLVEARDVDSADRLEAKLEATGSREMDSLEAGEVKAAEDSVAALCARAHKCGQSRVWMRGIDCCMLCV